MMDLNDWRIRARKVLIDSALSEIDIHKTPNEVYLDAIYSMAKCGILMKAIEAGIFEKEAWQKKQALKSQMEQIRAFLWEEIK